MATVIEQDHRRVAVLMPSLPVGRMISAIVADLKARGSSAVMDVRMSRRESGYMRFGADGGGQHDDLMIALALAVWRANRF